MDASRLAAVATDLHRHENALGDAVQQITAGSSGGPRRTKNSVVQAVQENPLKTAALPVGGISFHFQWSWTRYNVFVFAQVSALLLVALVTSIGIFPRKKLRAAWDQVDAVTEQLRSEVTIIASMPPSSKLRPLSTESSSQHPLSTKISPMILPVSSESVRFSLIPEMQLSDPHRTLILDPVAVMSPMEGM
jgi:hypothetical protein